MKLHRFKSFNENKQSNMKNWSINISSVVEKPNNLTDEEIHRGVFSIANPLSMNWHKEQREKTREEYKGTQGEWQVNKSEEIELKFIENLKLDIGDKVTVSTDFNVEFPDDWDRGFVLDWSEGMIRLIQEYLFVAGENMMAGVPKDIKYNEIRLFLTDVIRHQSFKIEEIR